MMIICKQDRALQYIAALPASGFRPRWALTIIFSALISHAIQACLNMLKGVTALLVRNYFQSGLDRGPAYPCVSIAWSPTMNFFKKSI